MAFPTSPSNGQIYKQYVYNSTTSVWQKIDPGKYFDIGHIYTQYPGKSDPSTLGWYGTWTNISSTFAGDFFRAEGGNATAFEAGEQTDAMQGHVHAFTQQSYPAGVPGAKSGYGYEEISLNRSSYGTSTNAPSSDGTNGTPRTATETRPVNRTIRIWERTA